MSDGMSHTLSTLDAENHVALLRLGSKRLFAKAGPSGTHTIFALRQSLGSIIAVGSCTPGTTSPVRASSLFSASVPFSQL